MTIAKVFIFSTILFINISCSSFSEVNTRKPSAQSFDCLQQINNFSKSAKRLKYSFHSNSNGIYSRSNSIEKELYESLYDDLYAEQELIDKIINRKSTSISNFFSFLNGQPSLTHFKGRRGFFGKLFSVGQDFVVPFAKFLSPIPLPSNWGRGPTHKILRKLWKDSSYVPTPIEKEILKKYNTYEHYVRVQLFFKDHPNLKGTRKAIAVTASTARTLTAVAASVYAYEQLQGGLIDVETFLDDPKYKLKDNQVQLIMETVPFPHTAIRVGNTIYSYGQSHMSATPIVQYIKNKEYNQAIKDRMLKAGIKIPGEEVVSLSEMSLKDRLSAQLSGITGYLMEKTGLSKMPKSMQVVTINLTKEARGNLKRELVLNTANRYKNITFVNDCTTMVFRAIEKTTDFNMQNRLWDASPSQSAMILALMKAGGSKSIGPIYQVAIEQSDKPVEHLIRNTYINILESKIFIQLFHFNQGQRLALDLSLKKEGLQSRDKETTEYIKKWEIEISQLMGSDLQLKVIQDQVSRFPTFPEIEKDEVAIEINESIDFIFGKYISKAESLINSNESDFQTIIFNEYRIEYLNNLKRELLDKIEK